MATESFSTGAPIQGEGLAQKMTPRILLSSLIGTSVEFYDFYIYATAASLIFGPLFFPDPSRRLSS
ncbi:hypothetical protein N7E02_14080 [Aliirhizobium terrae]|uniref:hypothetical protein n=1 Tax=Terrirhizobium terrae TaxID=2926709 RepID=UPI0025784282|nr:hypothetical protein [Rhizobium sp. CC-CFT758]WJH41490.1 hypothetical protein N7E02_14080 [Rhizobium sp. CC-CFT758]